MKKIEIISSSIRIGRRSHRVAKYFKNYIGENKIAEANILDLNEFQFPLFEERFKNLEEPSESILKFVKRIKAADGIIIVTPEYNGGIPAGLMNVVDLLYEDWQRKPIAISTVSDGVFGGSQVITSLQFKLWKIKALTVTAMFPVPKVDNTFDEEGNATDAAATDKRAKVFVSELMWFIEAVEKMKS
jgi:NAD(P)H-dependent FMN reductase